MLSGCVYVCMNYSISSNVSIRDNLDYLINMFQYLYIFMLLVFYISLGYNSVVSQRLPLYMYHILYRIYIYLYCMGMSVCVCCVNLLNIFIANLGAREYEKHNIKLKPKSIKLNILFVCVCESY